VSGSKNFIDSLYDKLILFHNNDLNPPIRYKKYYVIKIYCKKAEIFLNWLYDDTCGNVFKFPYKYNKYRNYIGLDPIK